MKLAAGFAVFCTASTQGFATAEAMTSVPNLAFIKLPGLPDETPQAAPFHFRELPLPPAFLFQANTPIPMEWWQQGSSSPLAIVIGNAEGTRRLDGSMNPAYYWHRDPGNGANNFGSFSFQHLSPQETAGVLDQANGDAKRLAAAHRTLPEMADQRQLVKLRRFHDLLQAQAQAHGIRLTPLELINGLDLATQSELAGLDDWGYVDRLVQIKKTIADPEEQVIRARTWSYWDPVKNRWAAPGLGNTEYYIRRDQARRFDAVKQAMLYQEQQPSLLQEIDLAWTTHSPTTTNEARPRQTEDGWAIALLHQSPPLEGSSFNRHPLQLEPARNGLENLLAETAAAEAIIADAIAENATLAIARTEDISLADVDFKGELNRAKRQASVQLSDADVMAVALGRDRPLALETESEPAWDRLAMTPEEFALATAIATPGNPSAADVSLATATATLETAAIAMALEASVGAASVETASALASKNSPVPLPAPDNPAAASVLAQDSPDSEANREGRISTILPENSVPELAKLTDNLAASDDLDSGLLTVQPFIPEELQSLPLEESMETKPTTAAVKPGQSFQRTPDMAQLAALAHVQAAEPLISDRLESQEFLDLASGLKESPLEILDESLGLAVASESPTTALDRETPGEAVAADHAASRPATIHFAPQATALEPIAPWLAPEASREIEAPLLEPIIPPDVQAMMAQPLPQVEAEQNISDSVVFFEENLSQ